MKVLVVEDDRKVGQFIQKGLLEVAYTATLARSCKEARDILSESHFDAIVLDLGLPDGDGLDLLREWRSTGWTEPVIILSARDALRDRVEGLNLGADDYLPKPFSFDELLARLRSLMRRAGGRKTTRLEHNGIVMDLLARTVTVDENKIDMTNREFALLELFLSNAGRVLTRTQISERVWDAHFDMETNLIDVYVRKLRLKLAEAAKTEREFIKTQRGTGYTLG